MLLASWHVCFINGSVSHSNGRKFFVGIDPTTVCFFSAFDVNNSQHDDPFYHSLVMWMFVTLWGWGQKEKRKPGKQKRLTIRWKYSPPSLVYEQCTLPLCYSSWHRCGQVRFVELNRPIVWPSSLWSEAGVPIEASSWHPFSMVVGFCLEWASPDKCG